MHEIDLMLKYQLEGKNKEARALSDKLEAIGPKNILDPMGKNTEDIWFRHCFNRGWFLLQDGKYQEGSQLLEYGRALNTYGGPPIKTSKPLYNPKLHDIKGKSILITLEGGYGDEIIHSRFATSFKKLGATKVYLAAAPDIAGIFSRIEGVDRVILRSQYDEVDFDYWIPGFSAGWLAGHTIETIPSDSFLSPLPEQVKLWENIINSKKIKVGIRWAGNPKFEHQQFRKFPPEFLTNLCKYPELEIYSLQRDHNTIKLPEQIIDLQHILISWEDTLAAIANLDIVITSCTSIAHLSASMGKETWVIVPILPYHVWSFGSPDSTSSPYYKSATIYRQKEPKKWKETFTRLYEDLEKKYNLKHLEMPNEDKTFKKLNLGCGFKKIDGFVNVDKIKYYNPDIVHDLNNLPWPFKDNEFDHIVLQNVIQQLGETQQDFIKILSELVRVSENGGIWELEIPFFRSDSFVRDIENKHPLTVPIFSQFNKKKIFDNLMSGIESNLFCFTTDIDIEVCDFKIDYNKEIHALLNKSQINLEDLQTLGHINNNVIESYKILIQVYKPGRVDKNDIDTALRTYATLKPLQQQ